MILTNKLFLLGNSQWRHKYLGTLALSCILLAAADAARAQIATTPPAGSEDFQEGWNNLIGVSGDYLIGYGKLSLPFAFAVAKGGLGPTTPTVNLGDRDSTYYGGTISYSHDTKLFFDFSFSRGTSTADTPQRLAGYDFRRVEYEIDDDWYQFYIRYSFSPLDIDKLSKLSAYLRAGVTYVDTELSADGKNADFGVAYGQRNEFADIQGNFGLGISYAVIDESKVRLSLFGEAEGFAGTRNQDIEEDLTQAGLRVPGSPFKDTLDNVMYGGLGRFSIRFEYFPRGRQGRLRLFADGGVQYRYTRIQYDEAPGAGGDPSFDEQDFGEVLWGPYVKAGIRFAF